MPPRTQYKSAFPFTFLLFTDASLCSVLQKQLPHSVQLQSFPSTRLSITALPSTGPQQNHKRDMLCSGQLLQEKEEQHDAPSLINCVLNLRTFHSPSGRGLNGELFALKRKASDHWPSTTPSFCFVSQVKKPPHLQVSR